MLKHVSLIAISALTALGTLGAPVAFAAEVHDDCVRLGLNQGIYPPAYLNPTPAQRETFRLTFDPTKQLALSQIAAKPGEGKHTGALLCGTDPDYNGGTGKFFGSGTITSEHGVTVHCANDVTTPTTSPEVKYCQRQKTKGTMSCKSAAGRTALCRDPVVSPYDPLPDGSFAGRGKTDTYCTSGDLLCDLVQENYDDFFKTQVDYDTDDEDHGIAPGQGYDDRCTPEYHPVQCFEARGEIELGPQTVINCNSDTIVSLHRYEDQNGDEQVDPTRVDLTIYPMACDSNIGKDMFLTAVPNFNLCQYADPEDAVNLCENVPVNEAMWLQTNGWDTIAAPGPDWTYNLAADMVDVNHDPLGIEERAIAVGDWTP